MFAKFKQRSHELERLDTGDYTAEEYERWQREMPFIHKYWGELGALRSTLIRDVRSRKLRSVSILDVGAGSGSLLRTLCNELAPLEVFAVANELNEDAVRSAKGSGLPPVRADGAHLPFDDGAFDYVICTLLLHHLPDPTAQAVIKEMDRIAARNFFAVDLNRHPVGYYGYKVLSRFLFQKFTRDDGALSILRSFTPLELLVVARDAGVENATVRHSRANRLILSRG